MGNMLGTVGVWRKKFSEGSDLAKLVTLSLAAFLSFEPSSTATTVVEAPRYDLPVQRYFSPPVNQVGFSDSRGFAPTNAPQPAPSIVHQEQQRWVF